MNIVITLDENNITNYILEYTREQNICTGIGTFSFLTIPTLTYEKNTWNTVELTEEGIIRGKYIVTDISKNNDGKIVFNCQDNSKRLQDNFITDLYDIGANNTCRYWINKFIEDSGIDCIFTTSELGGQLNPYSQLGMSSAYDLVMSLLAQSGWYMYFDSSGNAIIGGLNTTADTPTTIIEYDNILSVNTLLEDSMLRNRAVVWGSGNADTGEWVFSDKSVNTQWNYDSRDKRTVVLANSYIHTTTTANNLATKLLDEFSIILDIKTYTVIGSPDVNLGDIVQFGNPYDRFGSTIGLITSISSELKNSGFITKITINQRCSRLFGYFDDWGGLGPYYGPPHEIYSNVTNPPYSVNTYFNINEYLQEEIYATILEQPEPPYFMTGLHPELVGDGGGVLCEYLANENSGQVVYIPASGTYYLNPPIPSRTISIDNTWSEFYSCGINRNISYFLFESVDSIGRTTGISLYTNNILTGGTETLLYTINEDGFYNFTTHKVLDPLYAGGSITLDIISINQYYTAYNGKEYLIIYISGHEIDDNKNEVPNVAILLTDVYNITDDTHDVEYLSVNFNALPYNYESGVVFDLSVEGKSAKYFGFEKYVGVTASSIGYYYEYGKTLYLTMLINLETLERAWYKLITNISGDMIGPYETVDSAVAFKNPSTNNLYFYISVSDGDETLKTHVPTAIAIPEPMSSGEIYSGVNFFEFLGLGSFVYNRNKVYHITHPPQLYDLTPYDETPDYTYEGISIYEITDTATTLVGHSDENISDLNTGRTPLVSIRMTDDTNSIITFSGSTTKTLYKLTPTYVSNEITIETIKTGTKISYPGYNILTVYGNTIRAKNYILRNSGESYTE